MLKNYLEEKILDFLNIYFTDYGGDSLTRTRSKGKEKRNAFTRVAFYYVTVIRCAVTLTMSAPPAGYYYYYYYYMSLLLLNKGHLERLSRAPTNFNTQEKVPSDLMVKN